MAEEREPLEPQTFSVSAAWVDNDDLTVALANQFLFQAVGPNEYLLSIGQAVPPILTGSPEEQQAQLAQIPFIPIRTLGRFSLTEQRVEELIRVLQGVLDRVRETQKK